MTQDATTKNHSEQTGVSRILGYPKRKPVNATINALVVPALTVGAFFAPVALAGLFVYGSGKMLQDFLLTKVWKQKGGAPGFLFPMVGLAYAYQYSGISDADQHEKARQQAISTITAQIHDPDTVTYKADYAYKSGSPWSYKIVVKKGTLDGKITDWQGDGWRRTPPGESYFTVKYKDESDPAYGAVTKNHVSMTRPKGYENAEELNWAVAKP